MKPQFYKSTEKIWVDEAGDLVPYNRTTDLERLKEQVTRKLFQESTRINERLEKFKGLMDELTDEIVEAARAANEVKLAHKGNYTFYNFDRSVKIEVSINETIRFDDLTLESAKEVLLGIVRNNISGDDFIIGLVEDAFQTSRGRLDTRKILGLKKHTKRIKNTELRKEWEKAMRLIDESISRPDSKTYYRIWAKDEAGKYQAVELNFSSI